MKILVEEKINHLLEEQIQLKRQINLYESDRDRIDYNTMLPPTIQEKILIDDRIRTCRSRLVEIDLELTQLFGEHNPAQPEPDKPLSTRERNTLLVIIAALAKAAKIDLSKPTKAADLIAKLTQELGAGVDSMTIEIKIKLIDDALERRMKPDA